MKSSELPIVSEAFDPYAIARAVAKDLRELYGERLSRVILFGSWARGDAHPESDIDLLVVLDKIEDHWTEHQRMSDILWKHSFDNDTVVSAFAVAESEIEHPVTPTLIRISIEGRAVA